MNHYDGRAYLQAVESESMYGSWLDAYLWTFYHSLSNVLRSFFQVRDHPEKRTRDGVKYEYGSTVRRGKQSISIDGYDIQVWL